MLREFGRDAALGLLDFVKTGDQLRAAEDYLHRAIPITRAMGVRVVAHPSGFAVEAPVALNYNHLHTAFGGSIAAVATLAGYVFLWFELHDANAHVLIRDSAIRYMRPVRETITAVCAPVASNIVGEFRRAIAERRKARLHLRVRVEDGGEAAAEFEATFVALRAASASTRDIGAQR